MYIVLGMQSGNGEIVIESDHISKEEILKDMTEAQYEIQISGIKNLLSNISDMDGFNMTINGVDRYFNPSHIIWIEMHEEDQ